ncbi:MAG: DUF5985 family protein [Spongiibacteraceae bacterium]
MAVPIYFLCMLTSGLCSYLLFSAYRKNHVALLMWSAWCFAGLTFTNFLVILDRVFFPDVDLLGLRLASQLIALSLLLFGLLWREN